jgi:hypothetical protein
MHKLIFILLSLVLSVSGFAQTVLNNAAAETGNFMENNGKIYVVLTVCLVILTGIFLFLWQLEKRISRHEKQKE